VQCSEAPEEIVYDFIT